MFILWVLRDGDWHIMGQYADKKQADAIAADYQSRGEYARVEEE